ncbi:39 kDa initiator binding protein [Tritrichomonas foetus]|uniref:39 kDa initiator binding protein n=1 Tax=Tritrichomonas foetus TaxID=1144522 RepID=A0A1J4KII9_9EUKA|nr:39 kDa initiator binding protein [Tritrichomonas foetus]|eukprot:OHT11185.1 39 kDa initiator binding protein [Tritrichomonas foetus]
MEIDFSSGIDGFEALPPDIQAMLKRKSSRDPISRFSNKLHMLLNFADKDLMKQEFIGAGWTEGNNFRINKKRLIQIMDIKLNTLNVNLKDLKFQQLHSDQSGWTLWCREGFTPNSTVDDIAEVKSDKFAKNDKPLAPVFTDDMQQSKLAVLKDITLGKCDSSQTQIYKKITISIWEELIDSPIQKSSALPAEFINLSAVRFRASHQKLENAKEILHRIFICADPSQLTIIDFAVFMARFGPEETLMQKVGSLLKSSNENNNWLRLTTAKNSLPNENSSFYGFFDEIENNGFVLHRPDGTTSHLYNIVDTPATEAYLIDADGQKYNSWQDYFAKNPVESIFGW